MLQGQLNYHAYLGSPEKCRARLDDAEDRRRRHVEEANSK